MAMRAMQAIRLITKLVDAAYEQGYTAGRGQGDGLAYREAGDLVKGYRAELLAALYPEGHEWLVDQEDHSV